MSRLKTVTKRWPILLFVLVLAFSGITAWHYANAILDSDAASELVLGHLLANENAIVSADWFYSSEIRFFGTNMVYTPLFKLLDDWHIVRFVSIVVMQILLAASYYYLSRRLKMRSNAFFLSASLMMLPVNVVYGRIVLYHNYYIPCLVYGFLIAGLYLSVIEHRGQGRFAQAMRLAAIIALSLISCLNGFRQFPTTMFTLLIVSFVIMLTKSRGQACTLSQIPGHDRKNIGLAGLVFLSGLAGLYIYTHILSQFFHFIPMDGSILTLASADGIRNILNGYLALFGFQEGRALFSLEGLLAVGGMLAALVLLAISFTDLASRKTHASFTRSFSVSCYPVAMLSMTAAFLVLPDNTNYPQYYLPAFAWIFPWLGVAADGFPASIGKFTFKQSLIVLACVCLFANGVYNNLYFVNPDGKQVTYDIGIDIHAQDHLAGAIGFIEENGLEVGYATFWNANLLTEATNGQIPMISIIRAYPYNYYTYDDVLTDRTTRELSFIEDKEIFLLLTADESDVFSASELAPYSIPVYQDAYYVIYVFDFSTEVWDYLLEQAVQYNQQTVLEQLAP